MGTVEDELGPLVSAARGGERRAFDELVRRTHTDTYALAYRLCGNEEDARDVVQDAYLRAYRNIGKFRGEARFSTWMYRITANCAANLLHSRCRHGHEALTESVIEDNPVTDPVAQTDALALRSALADAIEMLSPKLRAVVVLRDIYEMPHEEIAAQLDISTTAAKVRLHRARAQLRSQLFGTTVADAGEAVSHAV